MKIAVLSDTHDLLRPEVLNRLSGCDFILHGGDVSSRKILDRLEEIAPVQAVRGNNDKEWAEQIARLYVTHPGVTADGIMAKMGL
ncbi:MAG: metallophosphoesterase family protein [Clostridia bacterium]|nr:metallophosphoesterase family protein [Clostridia bacterium]